ncbi:restriction endonuclease subunit S [Metamycoplasma hominis]|uniref:restriction endonuclease subunit S n=1 Tax=Metamycoplasma hominis TaxID=2098 RepID=UPI003CE8D72F
MNKIEKLIKELCPNGVEYKKIGEISTLFSGMKGVSKKWSEEGNCKFIDYMNCYKNFRIDVSLLKNATVKSLNQNILQKNDILFTASSETPDECCISSIIDDYIEDKIFMDDHLFAIRILKDFLKEINPIYLNFYFHCVDFRKKVNKIAKGMTRFYIPKSDFLNIQIPIPPLEIQNQIVNILDKFTEFTTELTTELTYRDKQYNYYRNKLLDFDNNKELLNKIMNNQQCSNNIVEYKRLWEIVDFDKKFKGVDKNKQQNILSFKHVSANELKLYKKEETGNVKLLSTGQYDGFTSYVENDKNINYGEIISIPSGGAPLIKYYKGYFIDSLNILLSSKDAKKYSLKFLYYFLIANKENIEQNFRGSSIKHPDMENIIELQIPLPPLEIQNKIVEILDKLETYTKDIQSGLPLEIGQRKKQYEYYRDKLLDFKDLAGGGIK